MSVVTTPQRAETAFQRGIDSCYVLIVDDHPVNRKLLDVAAQRLGVGKIAFAFDGLECIEKLTAGPKPDLILLDIMMPRLDGFETCKKLRGELGMTDVPVIIQTALSSSQDRLKCFEAGGTDVVTKPLDLQELVARMRVHLENRLMVESLTAFRGRLARDLDVARRMQRSVLPDPQLLTNQLAKDNLLLQAEYTPSDEVGGDIWAMPTCNPGKIAVFVADISGHGLVAAINAFRLHSLIPHLLGLTESPSDWLTALNREIVASFQGELLATAFYAVLDLEAGILRYAGAGAPQPLVGRRGADGTIQFEELNSRGLMLGIGEDWSYQEREVAMPAGSFLFLYSDCLIESGAPVSIEELGEWVAAAATAEDGDRVGAMKRRLAVHSAPPWTDDLTMIWLERA